MARHPIVSLVLQRYRGRLLIMGAGLLVYVLSGLLRLAPGAVEVLYATTLAPVFVRLLAAFSGPVPFSLAEWLYPLYGAVLAVAAWKSIAAYRAGSVDRTGIAIAGVTRLMRDGGVVVIAFYLLWGFNYSRAPIGTRLGWEAWTDVELAEAFRLGQELVNTGNDMYRALHGSDDAGQPTELPLGRVELSRTLELGWRGAVEDLDLPRPMAWKYGATKYLLSDPIFARLGISGIYFPFTAEANVRGSLPAIAMPQSVAHEQAHQRGIGIEAEASFLGYVAAMATNDLHVRYSATLFAQRRILNGIAALSRERYEELNDARVLGVRRDLDDLRAHYQQFVGVGTRVGSALNDRFLRANRVEGGVLNYGLAGQLLVQYARENGGTLAAPLAAGRAQP